MINLFNIEAKGYCKTPFDSELLNAWARSGSPQTLPIRHPLIQRGALAILKKISISV